MGSSLVRSVVLQGRDVREGTVQYTVTIPAEFVKLAGWDKGDELDVRVVLGSGVVQLEKTRRMGK